MRFSPPNGPPTLASDSHATVLFSRRNHLLSKTPVKEAKRPNWPGLQPATRQDTTRPRRWAPLPSTPCIQRLLRAVSHRLLTPSGEEGDAIVLPSMFPTKSPNLTPPVSALTQTAPSGAQTFHTQDARPHTPANTLSFLSSGSQTTPRGHFSPARRTGREGTAPYTRAAPSVFVGTVPQKRHRRGTTVNTGRDGRPAAAILQRGRRRLLQTRWRPGAARPTPASQTRSLSSASVWGVEVPAETRADRLDGAGWGEGKGSPCRRPRAASYGPG